MMRRYSDNKFRTSQPRRSVISRIQEREFETMMKNIDQLDARTRSIIKKSKQVMDGLQMVGKTEYKILHDLMELTEDTNLRKKLVNWSESLQRKEKARQDHCDLLQRCMIDPMKKYSSSFPSVYSATKKREQTVQEVIRLQAKVDKYEARERTGTNLVRLQEARKSLASVKDEFEVQRKQLTSDVPAFYNDRLRFIEPCMQSFIQGEWAYYNQVYEANKATGEHFSQDLDLLLLGNTYEEHLNAKLNEITQLSIVVGNERENDS